MNRRELMDEHTHRHQGGTDTGHDHGHDDHARRDHAHHDHGHTHENPLRILSGTSNAASVSEALPTERTLDLAAVRAKLQAKTGKQYWRSLEELAEDPHFEELLQREFPRQAPSEWDE